MELLFCFSVSWKPPSTSFFRKAIYFHRNCFVRCRCPLYIRALPIPGSVLSFSTKFVPIDPLAENIWSLTEVLNCIWKSTMAQMCTKADWHGLPYPRDLTEWEWKWELDWPHTRLLFQPALFHLFGWNTIASSIIIFHVHFEGDWTRTPFTSITLNDLDGSHCTPSNNSCRASGIFYSEICCLSTTLHAQILGTPPNMFRCWTQFSGSAVLSFLLPCKPSSTNLAVLHLG